MLHVDKELRRYVETEILPRYKKFDDAHQQDHALAVIDRSLVLAERYGVNPDMAYAVAAYHDTGLAEGREHHHEASARVIRADERLRAWFSSQQVETMADAAEDHRASSAHEPRSIYGKIVAEADRLIDPDTVIRRTVQYGLSNYPQYGREAQYERFREHLIRKYADGGYVRLWLEDSDNAQPLEALRRIICDETLLRQVFDRVYDELAH